MSDGRAPRRAVAWAAPTFTAPPRLAPDAQTTQDPHARPRPRPRLRRTLLDRARGPGRALGRARHRPARPGRRRPAQRERRARPRRGGRGQPRRPAPGAVMRALPHVGRTHVLVGAGVVGTVVLWKNRPATQATATTAPNRATVTPTPIPRPRPTSTQRPRPGPPARRSGPRRAAPACRARRWSPR